MLSLYTYLPGEQHSWEPCPTKGLETMRTQLCRDVYGYIRLSLFMVLLRVSFQSQGNACYRSQLWEGCLQRGTPDVLVNMCCSHLCAAVGTRERGHG